VRGRGKSRPGGLGEEKQRKEYSLVCEKGVGGGTLIKKKIKLSSYIRNFRMEQLQSHI
jgi:hypothetical protein